MSPLRRKTREMSNNYADFSGSFCDKRTHQPRLSNAQNSSFLIKGCYVSCMFKTLIKKYDRHPCCQNEYFYGDHFTLQFSKITFEYEISLKHCFIIYHHIYSGSVCGGVVLRMRRYPFLLCQLTSSSLLHLRNSHRRWKFPHLCPVTHSFKSLL